MRWCRLLDEEGEIKLWTYPDLDTLECNILGTSADLSFWRPYSMDFQ